MRGGPKLGEAPTLGMMRRELLELVRHEGEMLADIRASLDRIDGRFDDMTVGLCGLHRDINGFSQDIETIVGEAVRAAFREERDRKR